MAQEILHSMNRLKGQKGYFALKMDLAKAYDNLSWSFMEHVLGEARIPKVIKIHVMNDISTNKIKV